MGIYIALGTNIEPRNNHLQEAIQLLSEHSRIQLKAQSAIYETAPVGYTQQADFLNMVVQIETDLAPLELLDACQDVEAELGRKRTIKFGPRTIDVDMIVYENREIQTERLTVPHPRMHERAFVLAPLADLHPELDIPGFDQTVKELLETRPESERASVVPWTH